MKFNTRTKNGLMFRFKADLAANRELVYMVAEHGGETYLVPMGSGVLIPANIFIGDEIEVFNGGLEVSGGKLAGVNDEGVD